MPIRPKSAAVTTVPRPDVASLPAAEPKVIPPMLAQPGTAVPKPPLVAQIEFTDWTAGKHLRHSRFVALRDDKDPRKVVRETPPLAA